MGTDEVGIPEVGTAEIGTHEIGTGEIGTYEIGTTEIGTPKIGTPKIGTPKIGTAEISINEIGTEEIDTTEIDTSEIAISEIGISEISISEISINEIGTSKRGTSEVGTDEIGIPEISINEIGTTEIGTEEIGTGERGTSEIGTAEIGTGEIGTSKRGTSEISTTEIGTTEISINKICIPEHSFIQIKSRHTNIFTRQCFYTWLQSLKAFAIRQCVNLGNLCKQCCDAYSAVHTSLLIFKPEARKRNNDNAQSNNFCNQAQTSRGFKAISNPFSKPFNWYQYFEYWVQTAPYLFHPSWRKNAYLILRKRSSVSQEALCPSLIPFFNKLHHTLIDAPNDQEKVSQRLQ